MSKFIDKDLYKQLKALQISEDLSTKYTVTATSEQVSYLEKSGYIMVSDYLGNKYTFTLTYQGLEESEKGFKTAYKGEKKFNSGWLVLPALAVFGVACYVLGTLSLNGVI